jgi:hypothetical protein
MQCSAQTRSGRPCKSDAIRGGNVCRMHGGSAPKVVAKAAVRAEVLSWRLGDAVDDPGEVLLRLVTQSRMRADTLAAEIDERIAAGRELYGDEFTLSSILVGSTYFEGQKTGEYIRGLVQLEAQERDRMAGFAAKAVAAGLGERMVRQAEQNGELLFLMLSAVIADKRLALTGDQRKAMPDVIRAHLAEDPRSAGRGSSLS